MTYLDAHYARLRLADDLGEPNYQSYLRHFVNSRYHGDPRSDNNVDDYLDVMGAVLEQAETFTMSHNMFSLVQASAEDMPAEPLRPEDLPSKEGFLWLAEPISELDIRGRLLRHHAVMWSVVSDRVRMWWFADRSDNMDEVNQVVLGQGQNLMQIGRFMLAESTVLHLNQNLPVSPDTTGIRMLRDYGVLPQGWETTYHLNYETITDDDGSKRLRYIPIRLDPSEWPGHGIPDLSDEQFALIEDAYQAISDTEQINDGLKQLVCFWRLCQQTLSAREYEQPHRALRKQMIRRKLVPKAVTVIILRRRKATGEGQNTVEWDHRWVRRGHWRQAWYGPMQGERYQRAVYINPTICGPEDKPLIIRPHVNVLKR